MVAKGKRPSKQADVVTKVRPAAATGMYSFVDHAAKRLNDCEVTTLKVVHILQNGWHEVRKDDWQVKHNAWNDAIRGRTLDQRKLRLAVALDPNGILIITVIDLDKPD